MYIRISTDDQLYQLVADYCQKERISQQQLGYLALREFFQNRGYEVDPPDDRKQSVVHQERIDLEEVYFNIRMTIRKYGPMYPSELTYYLPHSYPVIKKALTAYQNHFIFEKVPKRKGTLVKLKRLKKGGKLNGKKRQVE